MQIIRVEDICKEWKGMPVFNNVSFDMNAGERIAIIGRNGVGKTTLLQCLLGRAMIDSGFIERSIPLEEWGALDQQALDELTATRSLLEVVQSASGELYEWKRQLMNLQQEMQADDTTGSIVAAYGDIYERYAQLGGYDWEVRIEKSLHRMNLGPHLWDLAFDQLSGGQKTRAQLAALMVREPKMMILDEPTNHLDTTALDWLEGWIRDYPGTVLYVSHDRTFIDRTATAVLELTADGCKRYTGGYSNYREQKELETRTQEALQRKQRLEREKLLESIRRYEEWFRQSHRAAGQNDFYRSKAKKNVSRMHAKESALERLEREQVERPREQAQLKMRLDTEASEAPTLLRVEQLEFAYEGGLELFKKFSFSVGRGDRIAVLGPNGAGKSTLLKLVTGQLEPVAGRVRIHPQTRVGYFAQELDNLDKDETILDSMLELPGMTQSHARTILGCFLFSRDDVFKRIGELSMGEQCRVAFLRLYFGRGNLLVLDEPTNYLDIDTRERVEEALMNYPGAILLVTHDRYLVRKVASRLLVMGGDRAPTVFDGTYEDYQSRDRSRKMTIEEQSAENELAQLELRLAQLMSSDEESFDVEEQRRLIEEINRLKASQSRDIHR